MVKLILTGADDGVGEVKQNLRQHGGETKTGSQVSLELKFPLGKKLWSVSVWLFLFCFEKNGSSKKSKKQKTDANDATQAKPGVACSSSSTRCVATYLQ